MKGEATCTSCHRMHGAGTEHSLKVAIEAPGGGHTRASDQLCTQCHGTEWASRAGKAGGAGTDPHTHHAPEAQGSRRINRHMSDRNWRPITRRLHPTFQPPGPGLT